MDVGPTENLATLRIIVGYLGEREQFAWWPSEFFAPGSAAFLAPLFARTQLLAQCNGVTLAAARIHDERIGVGQVYHLFRLPEDLEQGIHRTLNDDAACSRLAEQAVDRTSALISLRALAGSASPAAVGPVRAGSAADLRSMAAWSTVAAHYLHAVEQGEQVFPYFRDDV